MTYRSFYLTGLTHLALYTDIRHALWSPLGDSVSILLAVTLLFLLSQRNLCVWDATLEKLILAGLIASYTAGVGLEMITRNTASYRWVIQLLLVGFLGACLKRAAGKLPMVAKAVILILLGIAASTAVLKSGVVALITLRHL